MRNLPAAGPVECVADDVHRGLLHESPAHSATAITKSLPLTSDPISRIGVPGHNASYLVDHMGAGSHCRLLRALGHQASEPPGGTFSPSAPKLS
jgi:hypothetical protein